MFNRKTSTRFLCQDAKPVKSFNRRFSPMDVERNTFKNITAEASLDWARDPELVEGQRAQRINFLFVGRRRQTKIFLKLELKVLPNRRLPIGQKRFPQRALRLCGEMSESLSVIICVNLRLIAFEALRSTFACLLPGASWFYIVLCVFARVTPW